jgi:hypothetical protein
MLRLSSAIGIALTLAGCQKGNPAVHVAYERSFSGKIDDKCIELALRKVVPGVRRDTYQADGNGPRGFNRGTIVTRFSYVDPSRHGEYSLDVATQPGGVTHYWHAWGKKGTKVSADDQAAVLPLLTQANHSVERTCRLSFTGASPLIGDGSVRFPPS